MKGGQTVLFQQGVVGRRLPETVADAQPLHRRGPVFAQDLGHGPAQPTDNGVILGRQHLPGPGRRLHHGFLVHRLQGRQVQHVGRDVLFRQQLGRPQGAPGLLPGGNDGHIAALARDHGQADLEAMIRPEDDRVRIPGEPHVDRTVAVGRRDHGQAHLHCVRRRQHGHVGHGPHDGDVGNLLVGLAGIAGEQAGVGRANLHIQPGLRHHHPQLVQVAVDQEAGETAQPGHQTAGSHARGHSHHVLLGDAHLQKPLGPLQRHLVRLGGIGQIPVQHVDPLVLVDQLDQGVAEGLSLSRELICEFCHQSLAS